MKLSTFTGTSALLLGFLLTFGFAAPSYAQDQQEDKPKQQESGKPQDAKPEHDGKPKQQAEPPKTPNEQPRPDKEKEAKPPKQQPQAEQPKTEKQSKQAEKQNEQQQKEQQKQYGQQRGYSQEQSAQQSGHGGGGRIPDDRFHAHFGREHHFHVGHPQIVEGRPHFEYGGYSFIIVQAWPGDWGYDDDVYIVDDGGVYYLCDVAHPGVQLELDVVL
jgi:DNA mismatch repair ATPase MutL